MSTPSREELLSAFLDGETSPEETARLEALLSTDPELREHLQDLREISRAVQQIPSPAPPSGLHESVMNAIQQLPSDTASTVQNGKFRVHDSHSRSDRPIARRWWRWTSVISAGLVLSLTASLLLIPTQRFPLAVSMDEKLTAPAQPELASDQNHPSLIAAASPQVAPVAMEMAAPTVSPMAAPTPSAQVSGTAFSASPQESLSISASPAVNVTDVPVVKLSNDEIRRKIESLQRKPESGNLIQVPGSLMVQGGETPIVVVFTVVDVHQAMTQMQVLLQKQQVRTLKNEPVKAAFNTEDGDVDSLKVVSVELEMEGSEMASLLNGVPALDAVLYLANSTSTDEKPAGEKDQSSAVMDNAIASSNANPPRGLRASPPEAPMARSVQKENSGIAPTQSGETYQFRFDQLADTSINRGRDVNAAQITSLQEPASSGMQNSDAIQTFSSKSSVIKPAEAMKQKADSALPDAATAPARYRALILFQQPIEKGALPLNK